MMINHIKHFMKFINFFGNRFYNSYEHFKIGVKFFC